MSYYQVTLRSYYLGNPSNEFDNVFGYSVAGGSISDSDWTAFVNAFKAGVLAKIQSVVGTDMRFSGMRGTALDGANPDQETIFSPPLSGSVGGDALPLFCAWGFQYVRLFPPQRSGAKRFGYVAEADFNGITPTTAAQTRLDALGSELGNQISAGTLTWSPGIIKRTGAHTGTVAAMRGVVFKRMTSQNSRKR